jgi:DNA-damage-inducible protein J
MPKTAMIRARTEQSLKNEVDNIFKKLGITQTEAINIFYNLVKLNNGLPFTVKIPNKTTQKAFRDSDTGNNLKKFNNYEDLINDLNS